MLLIQLLKGKSETQRLWPMGALEWSFAGLLFGLMFVFGWRTLHWPLILITGLSVGGLFLQAIYARIKASRDSSKATPSSS